MDRKMTVSKWEINGLMGIKCHRKWRFLWNRLGLNFRNLAEKLRQFLSKFLGFLINSTLRFRRFILAIFEKKLRRIAKKNVVFELLGCGVLRLYLFDILVRNWLDFTLDKEYFSVDERATNSHRQPYENRGENHPHICLFAEY